jgi:superfamily I DNA and/or RNA helicase
LIIYIYHRRALVSNLYEAGQATDPDMAVCMAQMAKHLESIMLVGDHMQLHPVVPSAKHNEMAEQMKTSVFKRFVAIRNYDLTLLQEGHRMGSIFTEFPSAHFYDGKLISNTTCEAPHQIQADVRAWWDSVRGPDTELSGAELPMLMVFPLDGPQAPSIPYEGTTSYCNMAEANAIKNVVTNMLATGKFAKSSFLILSPYTGQVKVLKQMLPTGVQSWCVESGDHSTVSR